MKRLFWALSGIVASLLIMFASSSSASAIEVTYLSHRAYFFSSAKIRFPTTSQTTICNSHVGGNLNCFLDMASAGGFIYGGMDLVSDEDIPANSVVRFTITFSFPGSYSNLKFYGFTSQADWTIINQQVLYDDYSSISINLEIMKRSGSNNSIYLVPYGTAPVLTADVTNSRVIMTVTPYNRGTAIDGPWLVDSINDVRNKLANIATTNTLLESIKNNGITANVDNSDIIDAVDSASQAQVNATNANTTAVNNAASQAHSDAQSALAEQQKANEIAEEQKNFVTDTSTPEAGDIVNFNSLPSVGLLPAGPLDSILLLPVNLLNSIIQSFGGTCSPIVALLPFVDEDVTFPCMTDTLYSGALAPVGVFIGGVASAFILYGYFKHLYKKVDRAVSLETTDEDEWGIL